MRPIRNVPNFRLSYVKRKLFLIIVIKHFIVVLYLILCYKRNACLQCSTAHVYLLTEIRDLSSMRILTLGFGKRKIGNLKKTRMYIAIKKNVRIVNVYELQNEI